MYHKSEGINWDISFFSRKASDFSLAQWTTTWQNDAEAREFQQSNNKTFSDEQQILRLKTDQPVLAIMKPYRKDTKRSGQLIREIAPGYHLILQQEDSLVFTSYGFYSTTGNTRKVVSLLVNGMRFSFNNISMEGGPAEMEITEKYLKIRVHGVSGQRIFNLPFKGIKPLEPSSVVRLSEKDKGTEISINYTNTRTDLLSSEQGFAEWTWSR